MSRTVARASSALMLTVVVAGCHTEPPRPERPADGARNPASVGVIDIPAQGTVVGPILRVSGWAADEAGVAWVRLYADDRIIEHIPLNIARPDVEKVFPHFRKPDALHGWHATIDFGEQVGYTHISAEALDGRGALTRFSQIAVKIRP